MTIPGGYVLKARCIANSEIAVAPPCVRELWDLLIREANHTKKKYRGFAIQKGQLFRNYNELRESLHWNIGWRKVMYSKDQLKKGMKYLRDRHMIETQKAPGGVLITICNYSYYQDKRNYQSTNDDTIERTNKTPLNNQISATNNNNEKNVNKSIINKYMSEIKDSDDIDEHLKIAYEFWKLFKKNLKELNRTENILENAKCKNWTEPIRVLIESENKTKEQFKEIYQFLQTNEFWKDKIYSTSKFLKKNDQDIIYFDFFLIQYSKEKEENTIPGINEFKPVIERYFKNPTDHFINLFNEYQLMNFEERSYIFKGKGLDIEINKLAKYSSYDMVAAVNILNKSIKQRKEIGPLN